MLAADGPLERQDQIVGFIGDREHLPDLLLPAQVQKDHQVHVAVAGVPVDPRLDPVLAEDLPEPLDVLRKTGRMDRGVLDESHRPLRPFGLVQDRSGNRPDFPQHLHVLLVLGHFHVEGQVFGLHRLLDLRKLPAASPRLFLEFDEEHRFDPLGQVGPQSRLSAAGPGREFSVR